MRARWRVEKVEAGRRLAQMSFAEFSESVARDAEPPAGLSKALVALWHDAREQKGSGWEAAHLCAQEDKGRDGAWVHAYLHRKEGDLGNAGYWYARAGRKIPADEVALAAEWEQIARALLADEVK